MSSDLVIFDNPLSLTFAAEAESRTIRGLALPFGDIGESKGKRFRFSKDTVFTWNRPKLLIGHDWDKAIGTSAFTKTDEGLHLDPGRVARTALGDEALVLCGADAEQDEGSRVFDGLSVGLGKDIKAVLADDGVFDVLACEILEASLTPLAAFTRAAVTSVAASAAQSPNRKESAMDEDDKKAETPAEFDAVAFTKQIEHTLDVKLEAFQKTLTDIPPREPNPTAGGTVREELPYRFDGVQGGKHSLLDDAKAIQFSADSEAAQRMQTFLGEAFAAITVADVDELNPTQNRPELYVGPLRFNRPLWGLVSTGGITDSTPFMLPKFGTKTGKGIQAHVQGTEPTEMSLTTDKQTVTPSALSGLAIVNREVYDQGGNPSLDKIIWDEMMADYFDNLEAEIASLLGTGTGTEINVGGGASDAAKVALLKAALVQLQFVKGGDRFTSFAGDPTLYGGLAGALDSTGRPLLPVVNATNADGTVRAGYEAIQIGNRTIVPAWALDKTVANSEASYLFVPESVYAWVSAPKRIDLQLAVKDVRIGIWGYKASACTRSTDIVPVDWTTADA
jgi:hypothetical protein